MDSSSIINKYYAKYYDQICICYKILGVVPLTSCNCERGFSIMNIIKNYLSNHLSTKMVDYILRINDKKDEYDVYHYLDRSQEITNISDDMKDSRRRGPYSS